MTHTLTPTQFLTISMFVQGPYTFSVPRVGVPQMPFSLTIRPIVCFIGADYKIVNLKTVEEFVFMNSPEGLGYTILVYFNWSELNRFKNK